MAEAGAVLVSIGKAIAAKLANPATWKAIASSAFKTALLAGASKAIRHNSQPEAQGHLISLAVSSDEPRRLQAGKRLHGGLMVDWYIGGDRNRWLDFVIYLGEGPMGTCTGLFAGGRRVTGPLSHGVRYTVPDFRSGGDRLWVTYYDGRPGQGADPYLVGRGLGWTNAHKGTGCAYAVVTMQWDEDNMTSPPALAFELSGAKFYDRRKDTTAGGSGAHRLTDPSTWEVSTNPAVVLDHYLLGRYVNGVRTFGIGLDPEDVPFDRFAADASMCDETVPLSGGGSQKRYEVNGFLFADRPYRDTIFDLCRAMNARPTDYGGHFGLLMGETKTPVMTLDESDLVVDAPEQYAPKRSWAALVSGVEGRYIDAAQNYQPVDYPRVSDPAWAAEDATETKFLTLDLDMETSAERAQRLAWLRAKRERRQGQLTGTYQLKAVELERGDWFVRTGGKFGAGKTFEVLDRTLDTETFTVTITAFEVDPADNAWVVELAQDPPPPPTGDATVLDPLTAPAVTITPITLSHNGVQLPSVRFTNPDWDASPPALVWAEIAFDNGAGAPTGEIITHTMPAGSENSVLYGLLPSRDYVVRFRAQLSLSQSDWSAWQPFTSTATYSADPGASGSAQDALELAQDAAEDASAAVIAAGTAITTANTALSGAQGSASAAAQSASDASASAVSAQVVFDGTVDLLTATRPAEFFASEHWTHDTSTRDGAALAPGTGFFVSDPAHGQAFQNDGLNRAIGPIEPFTHDPDAFYEVAFEFWVITDPLDNGGNVAMRQGLNGFDAAGNSVVGMSNFQWDAPAGELTANVAGGLYRYRKIVGGANTAPALSDFVIPAAVTRWRPHLRQNAGGISNGGVTVFRLIKVSDVTARILAGVSESNALASASAAATSESSALSHADAASSSAIAASEDRIAAETAAGNSSTSAGAAAGFASAALASQDAAGASASAASLSEVAAQSAFDATLVAAHRLLPSTFEEGFTHWQTNFGQDVDNQPPLVDAANSRVFVPNDADFGPCMELGTGNSLLLPRGFVPFSNEKIYMLELTHKVSQNSVSNGGNMSVRLGATFLADDYSSPSNNIQTDPTATTEANGVQTLRAIVSVSATASGADTLAFLADIFGNPLNNNRSIVVDSVPEANRVWLRPQFRANPANESNGKIRAKEFKITDVTALFNAWSSGEAAASSATAASTHASTASTKATEAGGYATAASQSRDTAVTKAGEASVSAGQAAISADDAGGYASAASTSAVNALGYSDDAEGFASAASTFASTASTKAGEAATSANTALTHASAAGGHASAASGSAAAASASEIAAATYSSLAARRSAGLVFSWIGDIDNASEWLAEPGTATVVDDPGGSNGVLITEVADANNSGGTTGNAYLIIDTDIAASLYGKLVRVGFEVSRPASNASTNVHMAYSTNSVGNSQYQDATPAGTAREWKYFEYVIPYDSSPNNHYVGIRPDSTGAGRGVIVHRMEIEVWDIGASVKSFEQVLLDENGDLAAAGVSVEAGDGFATLELTAKDPVSGAAISKIRLKATTIEMEGTVLLNGTVLTEALASNAITFGASDSNDAETTVANGAWETVAEAVLTSTGGPVEVRGSCDVDLLMSAGQTGTAQASVRLYRTGTGGGTLRERKAGGFVFPQGSQGGTAYKIDGPGDIEDVTTPPAGTWTYRLQVYLYNGSAGLGHRKVKNRSLILREFKR